MEHEKTLAELAAEQRFDLFEIQFKEMVKEKIRVNPEIETAHNACEKYQSLIDALQAAEV